MRSGGRNTGSTRLRAGCRVTEIKTPTSGNLPRKKDLRDLVVAVGLHGSGMWAFASLIWGQGNAEVLGSDPVSGE
jgi:hypothetical protein